MIEGHWKIGGVYPKFTHLLLMADLFNNWLLSQIPPKTRNFICTRAHSSSFQFFSFAHCSLTQNGDSVDRRCFTWTIFTFVLSSPPHTRWSACILEILDNPDLQGIFTRREDNRSNMRAAGSRQQAAGSRQQFGVHTIICQNFKLNIIPPKLEGAFIYVIWVFSSVGAMTNSDSFMV